MASSGHALRSECTLTHPCVVKLNGFGLSAQDQLVLILQGTCGGADAVPSSMNYAPLATDADGSNASYILGTPTFGVIGDFYKLCWGFGPTQLSEFNVEVDDNFSLLWMMRRLRGLRARSSSENGTLW